MSELVLEKTITLPKGWINCSIEDIAHVILGQSPPSSTYNESKSGLPFFQGKLDFGDLYPIPRVWCSRPKKIAELDDVLLSVRAPVGSTNLSNQQCCIGRGLSAIRPKIEEMPSKFLLYFFINIKQSLDAKGTGTTFKAISGQQIRSLEISLPPLNEQKRIVAKIEELFSLLNVTKEILEKTMILLKQYRQSILKSAFEGKLVPQVPNDEPASVLLEKIRREKDSKSKIDFGMSELVLEKTITLPKGWKIKTAKELFYIKGRIGWRGLKKSDFTKNGPYLITGVDFKNGEINWEKCYHIPMNKFLESPEIIIQKNDILLTKDGTIGKVAFIKNIPDVQASLNAHLFLIRNLEGNGVYPLYLYYLLHSPYFFIFSKLNQTGTTRPALPQRVFERFPILLPPLNEQKRIVAKIEESFSLTHNSEKLVDSLLLQSNYMKNSILKQAFEGNLVPQDPNDEPAEILLEKIKQEKQKIISQTKRGKKNDK